MSLLCHITSHGKGREAGCLLSMTNNHSFAVSMPINNVFLFQRVETSFSLEAGVITSEV